MKDWEKVIIDKLQEIHEIVVEHSGANQVNMVIIEREGETYYNAFSLPDKASGEKISVSMWKNHITGEETYYEF